MEVCSLSLPLTVYMCTTHTETGYMDTCAYTLTCVRTDIEACRHACTCMYLQVPSSPATTGLHEETELLNFNDLTLRLALGKISAVSILW